MTGSPDDQPRLPSHGGVARELRALREKGLIRIRRLDLPVLTAAAGVAGFAPSGADDAPAAVEDLLRSAVQALGDDETGLAAQYLFGLVQGTVGRRTTDLRERAASVYGLSPETFRKEPERLLVDRVADEILRLCRDGLRARPATRGGADPAPGTSAETSATDVLAQLDRALQHVRAHGAHVEHRYGPFRIRLGPSGDTTACIGVLLGSVASLDGVDVVVSSENVYLQPSRAYSATFSGTLRREAAVRDAAGRVLHDVVAVELQEWLGRHNPHGGPVEAGVVAPTSSGRLAERGIRRIYHAAVAAPRPGTNEYDVSREAVFSAVRSCFELARAERADEASELRRISLPLFGSGRGRLPAATSFAYIWPALRAELLRDPSWQVSITVLTTDQAVAALDGLHRELAEDGHA